MLEKINHDSNKQTSVELLFFNVMLMYEATIKTFPLAISRGFQVFAKGYRCIADFAGVV